MEVFFAPSEVYRHEGRQTRYGCGIVDVIIIIEWLLHNISMQQYEVGKLIGTGSFGEVFLCRNKLDRNYYVAKKLALAERDERGQADIENELKMLKMFKHPNIVLFKDSFLTSKGLFIIMMFCEGGDLHSRIRTVKEKGKMFQEGQILDWLSQMVCKSIMKALAIHYLHMHRVLHRDLKSQNIFLELTPNGERVRIGDFGIAKVLDENQDLTATTNIGSPYYMAPQIFNKNIYSYKSDIWSLGCIAYELCNLRVPFDAQSRHGLIMKVMRKSYPTISPHYSRQLRQMIAEMLNKKSNQRPSIIQVLDKPLIRLRVQKFMKQKLASTQTMDPYYDTLKEQAKALNIDQVMTLTKYSSFASIGAVEEEEREKEKDAFVDHMKSQMIDKSSNNYFGETNSWKAAREKKNVILGKIVQENNIKRFKFMEDYSMEDSENEEIEEDFGDIIQEEDEIDASYDQSALSHSKTISFKLEEELPEQSKTYYKIFNQCQVLKNSCETALGLHKFLRACQLVEKGSSKNEIMEVIGKEHLGYWHLIEQTMFYDSLLREMQSKN